MLRLPGDHDEPRDLLTQAGTHVGDAIDAGADCLVTPCPLCHLNLDMQQPEAAKVVNRDLGLAVLHLPQLVGLALGATPKELGMEHAHRLDQVGRGAPHRRPGLAGAVQLRPGPRPGLGLCRARGPARRSPGSPTPEDPGERLSLLERGHRLLGGRRTTGGSGAKSSAAP